jgi:hypothetical protein
MHSTINLERLFQLRLVIARLGERDNAGWWNTQGLLGKNGSFVFQRGFPITYSFAQARVVFTVAAAQSRERFDPPGCATFWHVSASIEAQMDEQWHVWLDESQHWQSFFTQVAQVSGGDVLSALQQFGLITEQDVTQAHQLKRSAEGRAILLPHTAVDDTAISLLAVAFARSEPGKLAVPYLRVSL